MVKDKFKYESPIIKLNVGGTHKMAADQALLASVEGSDLAKLFNQMHMLKYTDDKEVFLDRDGRTFETLLNYLRNDRKIFPDFKERQDENMFFKELHFWKIDQEHRAWQEQYLGTLNGSAPATPN